MCRGPGRHRRGRLAHEPSLPALHALRQQAICVYIYIYICISLSLYIYISLSIYIYIYMYTHILT